MAKHLHPSDIPGGEQMLWARLPDVRGWRLHIIRPGDGYEHISFCGRSFPVSAIRGCPEPDIAGASCCPKCAAAIKKEPPHA